FLNDVFVDEQKAKAYYESNKEKLLSPATASGLYLEFPFNDDKETAALAADSAQSKAKKSKTLDGIANEGGFELKETGVFPLTFNISESAVPYVLLLASFGLEISQISDVIEGEDRFYILQLKTKNAPLQMTFEQSKEQINSILTSEISSSLALAQAQNIMQKIKSGPGSLEDAARELNLTVNKLQNVSRNSPVDNIAPAKNFLNESFAAGIGKIAGPIKTSEGWAVSRLDSITPIDKQVYEKDRDSFAAKLVQERENEAFKKWFQEIKQKANLKENL
ncbi:peptidyl-prolyl cis-trans isomerase, partial [bacterium]|nr:peptidyl-prolyl cis-trans isomerase [bacterium]